MWLSRVFVIGVLGFVVGFVVAYSQSIAEQVPSPELIVRGALWLWVALAYSIGLTVVLNLLFLPDSAEAQGHKPRPKGLWKPDAFTNPAHVQFALKVTLSAMFCYLLYTGIDWTGIHTAFITCIFIALDSTEATLYKGMLRIRRLRNRRRFLRFSQSYFLFPHMETIASLIVLVAAVSAIAGWIATGSERISYAGFQIAFAFFLSMFRVTPQTPILIKSATASSAF
jgi:uncharacterized membrane protein YccC